MSESIPGGRPIAGESVEGGANARAASAENTSVLNSPNRPPIRGLMSRPSASVNLERCNEHLT
jgi:hypothetical protein